MATTSKCDDEKTAINEQRFELLNAKSTEFDLDFAFRLQLEEALAASLSLVPSSSEIPEASSSHNDGDDSNLLEVHTIELEKLEQEKRDCELCEIEARKLKDDFDLRIHDQKLAMDIFRLSDEYWNDCGDEFERPFGEGSSSSSSDPNIIQIQIRKFLIRQIINLNQFQSSFRALRPYPNSCYVFLLICSI